MFVLFVLFFGHFLKQCALRPITFFLWVNISLLKKKIINTEEKKIQKKIKKVKTFVLNTDVLSKQ